VIPVWAISGLAAAAIAGFAGYRFAKADGDAKLAAERMAWQQAQVNALADQARAHNQKVVKLDANAADLKRMLDATRTQANAADAIVDAGAREHRRLRDAIATGDLAARTALDAAGTAGQCKASLEASNLRGRLLERLSSEATELARDAAAIGRHADESYAASVGCLHAYEVIR